MNNEILPSVTMVGSNRTRMWGLYPEQRVSRIAAKAGLAMAGAEGEGPRLLVNSDYVFDPQWFGFMRSRPNSVLTIGGVPAIAHAGSGAGAAAEQMERGQVPAGLEVVPAEEHRNFYNRTLRKTEWPFLERLTPQAVPAIERKTYYGAYKGVTDILTKYLWPEWALVLARLAARIGMSPNMVTAIGAAFNLAAMYAFYLGEYWIGMALGLAFMVLDTVDGKLARCTITSSKWGEVFDHGIDLVHPPFWWWAWAAGLGHWGLAFSPGTFATVIAVIVIGYVVQRLIEGGFLRRFGMHIHVWEKFDSRFRLITARRNPNMVILFVATLFGRPDTGLLLVAWWTAISCAIHAVRWIQAEMVHRRGTPIVSWLGSA